MANNYYIYIYLDPRKSGRYCYENICFSFEPFYVGKGKKDRWKEIKWGRNKYFKNKINKIKKSGLEPIVIKLYENLNEKESLKKEIEYINEIRKENFEILLNMTDGGDGISGYKFSEEQLKKQRKNFQEIKKEFERRGYILLTEEKDYKNNKTKLKYICQEGHENYIVWSSFQQGCCCPTCEDEKNKKDFSDIKKEFERRGYKLLSKENKYKNSITKLEYICPKGHNGFVIWNSFQQNHGCFICGRELVSEKLRGENRPNHKLTEEQVIQIKLLLKEGKISQRKIAKMFGVSQMTISHIKTGKNWSYIKV